MIGCGAEGLGAKLASWSGGVVEQAAAAAAPGLPPGDASWIGMHGRPRPCWLSMLAGNKVETCCLPPRPPQITLDPCTVLQPHTHPHSEFIFTIKGGSA